MEGKSKARRRPVIRNWFSRARWFARTELHLSLLRGMLLWAGLIGFLGAVVTVGFREAIFMVEYMLTEQVGDFVKVASSLPPWRRIVTPALGAIVAGLILQYGMHLAQGRRTTDYMEALTLGDGFISVRASLVKSASSLFSIGSGGSIGREGAMVQLAAMLGSTLCRILSFPAPQRRTMVACGAAAGIASAYNAPLAAAIFVSEIVVGSIEFETIAPIIVSSVIANATVHGLMGYETVFEIPVVRLVSSWELVFYLMLGVLAGRLAPVYLWLLKWTTDAFRRLKWPIWARLGLGGLGVGIISVESPQVWGNGYEVVNSILHNPWTVEALLILLVLKVLATAMTVGSGAVGGVFTPTLFVGATLGSLLGTQIHQWLPEMTGSTTAYAVVGMGAFLSSCTRAPMMAILMVFEMTRQYEIVLPLMLACITANYIALPYGTSIYADSLKRAPRTPLPGLSLTDLLTPGKPPVLRETADLETIKNRFVEIPYNHIHIVDENGRWLGIVGRKVLTTAAPEALAGELIREGSRYLHSDMTMQEALQIASEIPSELMPLVETSTARFLGTIAKSDLLALLQKGWRAR